MGTYKFKLESILQLKEKIEQDKKNNLGIAVKKLEDEKKILSNLEGQAVELKNTLYNEIEEGIPAWQAKNIESYRLNLTQKINLQNNNVAQCNQKVEECRQNLLKATVEKKTFEKLKEKDKMIFQYNFNKQEELMVDELVSYSYKHKYKTGV